MAKNCNVANEVDWIHLSGIGFTGPIWMKWSSPRHWFLICLVYWSKVKNQMIIHWSEIDLFILDLRRCIQSSPESNMAKNPRTSARLRREKSGASIYDRLRGCGWDASRGHSFISIKCPKLTGWWLVYPSEKYERQLGWWHSQYMGK